MQSGNSCLLHTTFSSETSTGYISISIMNYIECNDKTHINECICNNNNNNNNNNIYFQVTVLQINISLYQRIREYTGVPFPRLRLSSGRKKI